MDDIKFPIQTEGVLYSTQKRMSSIWKAFSMDDKGVLKIYEDRIQFSGNKKEFNMMNIKRIFTIKQNPGYGTHFISALISIGCIWFTFMYLHSAIEYFLTFFVAIIVLFPVSLFLTRSDWVGILYGGQGKMRTVFFTEGDLPKDSVLRGEDYPKKSSSLFRTLKLVKIIKEENSD